MYRVIHLLVDLGWVDFDLGVPPYCPAAQLLLPNSHQPKQNWSDGGTTKIKVNPTQVLGQMNHHVAYPLLESGDEPTLALFTPQFRQHDALHGVLHATQHGIRPHLRRLHRGPLSVGLHAGKVYSSD